LGKKWVASRHYAHAEPLKCSQIAQVLMLERHMKGELMQPINLLICKAISEICPTDVIQRI
jgi:hypothetical protein